MKRTNALTSRRTRGTRIPRRETGRQRRRQPRQARKGATVTVVTGCLVSLKAPTSLGRRFFFGMRAALSARSAPCAQPEGKGAQSSEAFVCQFPLRISHEEISPGTRHARHPLACVSRPLRQAPRLTPRHPLPPLHAPPRTLLGALNNAPRPHIAPTDLQNASPFTTRTIHAQCRPPPSTPPRTAIRDTIRAANRCPQSTAVSYTLRAATCRTAYSAVLETASPPVVFAEPIPFLHPP